MDDPVFAFPKRSRGPDLKAAMRQARIEEAERSGAMAELRGAELARLEMLREELAPVVAQIPNDAEMFDFGIVGAEKPRLFVDMVAYVEMGRDRRTFRFIQDTRGGRLALAESERLEPIVEAVTSYLGRRLVERERALAGETLSPLAASRPAEPASEPLARAAAIEAAPRRERRYTIGDLVFAFLLGMIVGAGLLFLAAWWKARGGMAFLGLPLLG
ncbi:hypothetical protein [Alsobacter sp. SYSU BS001988]|jgi:hypothetical protein